MTENQDSPPSYEGFDPKYDIEIDKETGCFMKGTSKMPGSDWCFLYHDRKYHFWFYAQQLWEGQLFDVIVRRFSSEKFYKDGRIPVIRVADLPTIKRNMETFFQQRHFLGSASPRPPKEVFRSLRFDWAPEMLSFLA